MSIINTSNNPYSPNRGLQSQINPYPNTSGNTNLQGIPNAYTAGQFNRVGGSGQIYSYEDMAKSINTNLQTLVTQLNTLQNSLNSQNQNPIKGISTTSPQKQNDLREGLINNLSPSKAQPQPPVVPAYPENMNTTFPTFPELIKDPPSTSNIPYLPVNEPSALNATHTGFVANPTFEFNKFQPNTNNLRIDQNNAISQQNIPSPGYLPYYTGTKGQEPNRQKFSQNLFEPLNKMIEIVTATVNQVTQEISKVTSQDRLITEAPIQEVSGITAYEIKSPGGKGLSPNQLPIEFYSLHPLWAEQIKASFVLDPVNEVKVLEHLVDLITDSNKMVELIESIFSKLNNGGVLLNSIEFKEFYDLTAAGMNAPLLDSVYIMKEYNSILKEDPLGISKYEMQLYVTKLYKGIVNYAIRYNNLRK